MGFPGCSEVKSPSASTGDAGLIPGLGRYPGEGNGNSLQHSCLGNAKDRGACQPIVHEAAKELDPNEQLNNNNVKKQDI